MFSSVIRTVAACVGWGVLHSLLATDRAKRFAGARIGEERRNGLYRISYNAVAALSLIVLTGYVRRLPDRHLYRIPWPWRALTGTARLLLLVVAARAALEVGLGPFSGISEFTEYISGKSAGREPEAQGPSAGAGGLRVGGPFRYVRHPLNASGAALVVLTPEMSVVRLTVAVLAVAYSVLGSKLEEARLMERYGGAYEQYRDSGVPFFVPSWRAVAGGMWGSLCRCSPSCAADELPPAAAQG